MENKVTPKQARDAPSVVPNLITALEADMNEVIEHFMNLNDPSVRLAHTTSADFDNTVKHISSSDIPDPSTSTEFTWFVMRCNWVVVSVLKRAVLMRKKNLL